MSTITLSLAGKVATLTINRADKRNALTQAMWQQLADYCDELEHEIKPRVLIVTAAGEQAFSAGADIHELQRLLTDSAALQVNNDIVQAAQLKLQRLPCATIAMINGLCFGGGMGIALCCDLRIAVAHAEFAITPAKLGLLYSIEDSRRLFHVVGLARAKWMLYSGQKVDASTALQWGLVHQVVASDGLKTATEQLVNNLLSASGYSIQGMKQTLALLSGDESVDENHLLQLFEQAFQHQDFKQAADAFVNKCPVEFD